jgi:hypothetical protein
LTLPTLVVVLFGLCRVVLFRNFHYVVNRQLSVISKRHQDLNDRHCKVTPAAFHIEGDI